MSIFFNISKMYLDELNTLLKEGLDSPLKLLAAMKAYHSAFYAIASFYMTQDGLPNENRPLIKKICFMQQKGVFLPQAFLADLNRISTWTTDLTLEQIHFNEDSALLMRHIDTLYKAYETLQKNEGAENKKDGYYA